MTYTTRHDKHIMLTEHKKRWRKGEMREKERAGEKREMRQRERENEGRKIE